MDEMWKDIPGYEGKYQVSNTGQVRSLNYKGRGVVKLLKQYDNRDGYKRVCLCKNGKVKNHWTHRLVAIAFIPNPNNYKEVNHKDENPSNNNVKNLEWCTHEYNMNYGTRNERASESMRGENNPNYGKHHSEEHRKKLSESHKGKYKGKDSPVSKAILMYDKEGNFIKRFDSIADANEYFGKDRNCSTISHCLKGRNKTVYGYIFRYAEENN